MQVGFLVFPQVTQLDLMGPLQVLSRMPGATMHVVAASAEPVPTDCGVGLVPTATFATAPALDVLCVPGGFGVRQVLRDPPTLRFVERAASGARWTTSVCTGAFVLGAVGVLQGRRATTHWAYRPLLARVGAIPVAERVVRDGPVLTGAGVTSGIDFALTLVAEICGVAEARRTQLALEYAPSPPFAGGDEGSASPETLREVRGGVAAGLASFATLLDGLVL